MRQGEELAVATYLIVKVVEGLSAGQPARRCTYNFTEPVERDVAWVVRHDVHELVHHEMDVGKGRTQLMVDDLWS